MTSDGKPKAKAAIVEAFNRLALSGRALKPPVAELLEEAGVARSTFYEHFDNREAVLIEALEGPLGVLADAATGAADPQRLIRLLIHFREQRRGAADLLTGATSARVTRKLAALIKARLGGPENAGALPIELANQQLGQLRLWLTGETRYPAERLAALLPASAAALRAAFAENVDGFEREDD